MSSGYGTVNAGSCYQVFRRFFVKKGENNMLGTVLIVLLVLMLLGAVPSWPHSRNWGYGPSGGIGLILLIIIILLLLGRI